jgi:TonB family protein
MIRTYVAPQTRFKRMRTGLLHASLLALALTAALPARAGDARPIKSRVPPVYPEIAKRMRISGQVTVSATVNEQGKVTDVKEVSGNHVLAQAAEDAVRQWKFEPAAAASNENIEVSFSLNQ